MAKYYKTSEIAKRIGIHPNTVRLYEDLELITKPKRQPNGYRIFTDLHIAQFQLARTALEIEVLQNGLRKQVIDVIKMTAAGDHQKALQLADKYLKQIQEEKKNAEEAIEIVEQLLLDNAPENTICILTQKEASSCLHISKDTLRNWELNGLLPVKRMQNGYRKYTDSDIKRLKVIRSLRCANYSLSAILRLLNALSHDQQLNIREVIDTPSDDDDIISICDKLLTSLDLAQQNAVKIQGQLINMKNEYD